MSIEEKYKENFLEFEVMRQLTQEAINKIVSDVGMEHGVTQDSLFVLLAKMEDLLKSAPIEIITFYIAHANIRKEEIKSNLKPLFSPN